MPTNVKIIQPSLSFMKEERVGEVKKKAHSWRPFVEARAFARQLGLKSRDELSSLLFSTCFCLRYGLILGKA
jgi:hypothetical protein